VGAEIWDWIHLAQDKHKWRGFVSTVMDLGVPQQGEIYGLEGDLLASTGICYMKLVS